MSYFWPSVLALALFLLGPSGASLLGEAIGAVVRSAKTTGKERSRFREPVDSACSR